MTICTHLCDCGNIGERELTISYKYRPYHSGHGEYPDEGESATINWIKIGGVKGVEVYPPDDYITKEIIPRCVADWHGEAEAHAEAKYKRMREELAIRRAA